MKNKNKQISLLNTIKEHKAVATAILIIAFVITIFLVNYYPNDGMEQAGIEKITYRVYTKKNGWSKWTKNGLTSGNLVDNIENIQIKINDENGVVYSYYTKEDNWSDSSNGIDHIKNDGKNIMAIKLAIFYGMSIKYDLCYRTYNKKDKWLEWSCNIDEINGNINEPITGVQLKIIPENVVKTDYLKNYNKNKNEMSKGF